MTTATAWRLQGEVMEACNCDVTCSCNFGGDPTDPPCQAVLGMHIREGNYGGTRLDGLTVVLCILIPERVFDGNWTVGPYLDDKASEEQTQALGAILSGEAGGWFGALGGLIGTTLEPRQVPIKFETVDGEHHITVPGLLDVGSERIPNPMPGEPPLDTKTTGLVVPFYNDGPASVRRSSVFSLTDPNFNYQHTGKSAFTGKFDYTGP